MSLHLHDVKYKVLLLGDAGVGKTALIRRLTGQPMDHSYVSTIGIDFVKKIFDVDGAKVQLEIWDTAGQERFRSITRFQYRGTKGLLLVFDVTDKDSFAMMNYWLDSIDRIESEDPEIDSGRKEPIPVLILGNKSDLELLRSVTLAQGKRLADESLVFGFLETSAKDGTNVETAFWQLAKACCEIYDPKLMDSYLKPYQKQVKDETRREQDENNRHIEEQMAKDEKKKRKRARRLFKQKSVIVLNGGDNTSSGGVASRRFRKFRERWCSIL